MSLSSSAVRMMLRPMRPNPLMPTLMGIPSSEWGEKQAAVLERMTAAGQTGNAMGSVDKSQRGEKQAAIMSGDEGPFPCVGFALAVRFGAWRRGPLASALDFSARAWVDLLLRVFLAGVSNPRIDWAAGNPSRRRIFASAGRTVRPGGLLVCADAAMGLERRAHAHGNLLGGHDCVAAAGFKFLAARNARDLFCVFPLVRERRAGF